MDSVVGLLFEQVEELHGEVQRLLVAAGQRVLGDRIEREGLAVEVLVGLELLVAGDIHLPVEPAVGRVPHLVPQEPIAELGGLQVLLRLVARPGQPGEQPHLPGLRHDHLRHRLLQLALGVEADDVPAVRAVQALVIPERHDVGREDLLQPRHVLLGDRLLPIPRAAARSDDTNNNGIG